MIFIVTALMVVGFFIVIICTRFVHKLIVIKRLTQLFGYPINDESYSSLNKEYFHKLSECDMNQTTADDFELDKIFNLMNRTYTDVGREYMYAQLFTKEHNHELLESLIEQLGTQKIFENVIYELYCLSQTYSESLELFDALTFLSSFDMLIVIITSLFPFLLIGLSFIYGLQVFQYLYMWLALQGMLYAHYTKKTDHAMSKALSYCYLVTTLDHLNNLHIYPEKESKKIRQMSHQALRYTYINKICDSIAIIDVFYLMELIKGIFSLPIYQCYLLLKHKDELKKSYLEMYEYVGMVDMAISMMSIRQSYQTCIPKELQTFGITFEECYHPLLEVPVKNPFSTTSSCIITGSNASGKSTFLKMIGVNIILAKAYHTCFADAFSYYPYHLCSSIHMKDDIESGDSYYVREIKTLKNIIDQAQQQQCIVFIDEILRGTNEKERVLIAKVILKYLFQSSSLIFVTTHDLSIVRTFDEIQKYCFNDYIRNEELCSDYKIRKGICSVGNAIALLEVYGFNQEIINQLKKPS